MREFEVELGGVRTRVLDWGVRRRDVVVAVHSAGLNARSMADFAAVVGAEGYRVVCADLRGHGESHADADDITIDAMASDLIDLAAALDLSAPRLVGISLGGVVAGLAAQAHPERWSDLAVVCSPDRGYPAFADRAVARRHGGMDDLIQPTVERWFTRQQQAQHHRAVGEARAALRSMRPAAWDAVWTDFATFPGWAPFDIPAVCVAGELDASTPPEVVGRVADAVGASCVVIPGAPHQLLMTHPSEFVEAWLNSA